MQILDFCVFSSKFHQFVFLRFRIHFFIKIFILFFRLKAAEAKKEIAEAEVDRINAELNLHRSRGILFIVST